MLIGYARTSTLDQKAGLEAQTRDLNAAGCERVFEEQVSSVDVVKREALAQAIVASDEVQPRLELNLQLIGWAHLPQMKFFEHVNLSCELPFSQLASSGGH